MSNLHMFNTIKSSALSLYSNSLLQNSMYPIVGTAVMAVAGFIFWIIVARLYATTEVGLAGTMIAIVTTLATFSLIGFDTSTIRFLAHEEHRTEYINTALTIVGSVALVLSAVFIVLLDIFVPSLGFIHESPYSVIAFILFVVVSSLTLQLDSVFISLRATRFSFVSYSALSIVKMFLPFFFIQWGAIGIFLAAAGAQVLGLLICSYALYRFYSHRVRFTLSRFIFKRSWRYSISNYAADVLLFLPTAALPIIIVTQLGAEVSALYYITAMIAGYLSVIPESVLNALFSEGSYNERDTGTHTRKAVRIILYLLIPAAVLLITLGGYILALFGSEYSSEGTHFLRIMIFGTVIFAASSLYATLFRLTHDLRALLVRSVVFSGVTILLTYLLIPHGLKGVGVAWCGGAFVSLLACSLMYHSRTRLSNEELLREGIFGRFTNLPTRIYSRLLETLLAPIETTLVYKSIYLVRLWRQGFKRKYIVFYPELPKTYHILYKVCHTLGLTMTTDLTKPAVAFVRYEDATHALDRPELIRHAGNVRVVNQYCTEISKVRVEKAFVKAFGYGTFINPGTFTGVCVRKSNENAVHDGTIIECPAVPEAGYIYQRLIDTRDNMDIVSDLRIYILNGTIPFVLRRFKTLDNRFTHTRNAEMVETDEVLSAEEQQRIVVFCTDLGLDYGELDALRDSKDGALYIIDANNTPAGPIRIFGIDREQFSKWFNILCISFEKAFLNKVSSTVK